MVGKPFNLAPSLHIAIVILLGAVYVRHVPWPWRGAVYVWGFLIGLSTLTAYQHHFFDIPTGAMLGVFCLWALPDGRSSPLRGLSLTRDRRRLGLAAAYTTAGTLLVTLAWGLGGVAWWLLWPALSAWLVAAAYAGVGPALFGKDDRGRMVPSAHVMLWPYLVAAKVNAALWTRGLPQSPVAAGVSLGRVGEARASASVVDLTAELPRPGPHDDWHCVPTLDLVHPSALVLAEASRSIEQRVAAGREVLVCCALGMSRSAAAVATWLVMSGRAAGVDEALAMVRAARPRVVLGAGHRAAIEAAVMLARGAP